MTREPSFAVLLEKFFIQRLIQQRQASIHTIVSYRDTFRLLLEFAQRHLHKSPSSLALADVDASLVSAFLDEQEKVRCPMVSFSLPLASQQRRGCFTRTFAKLICFTASEGQPFSLRFSFRWRSAVFPSLSSRWC